MLLPWPIIFVIYFLFIAVNYSILPCTVRFPLRHTLPGSLFASVGIILSSLGYQIYFSYFSNLNLIYGSLGALIAFASLGSTGSSYILLVGTLTQRGLVQTRIPLYDKRRTADAKQARPPDPVLLGDGHCRRRPVREGSDLPVRAPFWSSRFHLLRPEPARLLSSYRKKTIVSMTIRRIRIPKDHALSAEEGSASDAVLLH